jgi:hypothetical protein
MVEAIINQAEATFHSKDILREPGDTPVQGTPVDLHPGRWLTAMSHRVSMMEKRLLKAASRYFAKA